MGCLSSVASIALPVVGSIFGGPAGGAIGSAAAGLFGGQAGADAAPKGPNVYQPTGLSTADQNLQGLLNQNSTSLLGNNNPFLQYNPQFLEAFNQLFNTPGTAGYNTAAGNAGNAYTGIGNQALSTSGALTTGLNPLFAGANSVYNLGLDPQNQLYGQSLQRATDQANVTNAQYGLTGQAAAGSTNQAINNFNMDWQNQQLARALQGLQGTGQALTAGATTGTAAQNIGNAGAGSILAGGATPYSTGQTIGTNQENALAYLMPQLLGPSTSSQGTIGDLLSYLGYGTQAATAGNNAALNDYYAKLAGAQAGASGASALGGQLAGLFPTTSASAAGPMDFSALSNGLPWSDRWLKENIKLIGKENGHNIYEFSYIGKPQRYIGVMAQEVQKTHPEAVRLQEGFLAVDYDAIGVKFREVA